MTQRWYGSAAAGSAAPPLRAYPGDLADVAARYERERRGNRPSGPAASSASGDRAMPPGSNPGPGFFTPGHTGVGLPVNRDMLDVYDGFSHVE